MLILEDEKSYEKLDVFLREHRIGRKLSIDGILCTTDRIACYVINVLKRMNIRVPEDVQVIGFDGIRRPGCFDYLCSTIVSSPCRKWRSCVLTCCFRRPPPQNRDSAAFLSLMFTGKPPGKYSQDMKCQEQNKSVS